MDLARLRNESCRRLHITQTPACDRIRFRERIAGHHPIFCTRQTRGINMFARLIDDVLIGFIHDHKGIVTFGEGENFCQFLTRENFSRRI